MPNAECRMPYAVCRMPYAECRNVGPRGTSRALPGTLGVGGRLCHLLRRGDEQTASVLAPQSRLLLGGRIGTANFGSEDNLVLVPTTNTANAMSHYKASTVFAGQQIGFANRVLCSPRAFALERCLSLRYCHDALSWATSPKGPGAATFS